MALFIIFTNNKINPLIKTNKMIEKKLRPGNPFMINLIDNTLNCQQCGNKILLPEDFDIKIRYIYKSLIDKFKKKHKDCIILWKENKNE